MQFFNSISFNYFLSSARAEHFLPPKADAYGVLIAFGIVVAPREQQYEVCGMSWLISIKLKKQAKLAWILLWIYICYSSIGQLRGGILLLGDWVSIADISSADKDWK